MRKAIIPGTGHCIEIKGASNTLSYWKTFVKFYYPKIDTSQWVEHFEIYGDVAYSVVDRGRSVITGPSYVEQMDAAWVWLWALEFALCGDYVGRKIK